MANTITSVDGVAIRLPDERWLHIVEEHGELFEQSTAVLETVGSPERIFRGRSGEKLAMSQVSAGKFLVVVYREHEDDGFIITAFLTRNVRRLERREQIWP